jgi:hypothetical protein
MESIVILDIIVESFLRQCIENRIHLVKCNKENVGTHLGPLEGLSHSIVTSSS